MDYSKNEKNIVKVCGFDKKKISIAAMILSFSFFGTDRAESFSSLLSSSLSILVQRTAFDSIRQKTMNAPTEAFQKLAETCSFVSKKPIDSGKVRKLWKIVGKPVLSSPENAESVISGFRESFGTENIDVETLKNQKQLFVDDEKFEEFFNSGGVAFVYFGDYSSVRRKNKEMAKQALSILGTGRSVSGNLISESFDASTGERDERGFILVSFDSEKGFGKTSCGKTLFVNTLEMSEYIIGIRTKKE